MKLATIKRRIRKTPIQFTRSIIQIAFAVFLLYVGWQFYQFYLHFSTLGATPYVERPAAVEGFLPVSALVALYVWVTTWSFDQVHPAGLVMLTFFFVFGFLFRRAFCSWMCPLVTLSEWLGRIGKAIFKKQFEPPKWLRWILGSLKYILIIWIIYMVLEMPIFFAEYFLESNYNKISDVKMLLFFMELSAFSITVLLVLFTLTISIKNFWCRFVFPYGAFIGLGGVFGVTTIKRNEASCSDCKMCNVVCPQGVQVAERKQVYSLDCSSCMHCVEVCPKKDTLFVVPSGKKLNKWVIPVTFFTLFFSVVVIAKLTGNWDTNIIYDEY